jgi:hypothetical protein
MEFRERFGVQQFGRPSLSAQAEHDELRQIRQ